MSTTRENPLLGTDVYKMGHMEQYVPGCNKVYSYLMARKSDVFNETVFFGLQYYIKEYFEVRLTQQMGVEFLHYREKILGSNSQDVVNKITSLCGLGYFPLEIKAVKEGTVMAPRNVMMTITNTIPEFYWVVGFVESLILKIWYPITVASCCHKYRRLVDEYWHETVEEGYAQFFRNFAVHDFGYRGDQSEEGAGISGASHLLSFMGSDTVPAYPFIDRYYGISEGYDLPIMASVPASEHSVMCSFGQSDELAAFNHMLNTYPSGIVSIVSDTYDVYRVLTEFAERLKPRIMARGDGSKVVFRPDSGNPEHIICGDPNAPIGTNEHKGALQLLEEVFGVSVNEKGYKVLNPKVGLIYGDGMFYDRYLSTLERMADMGFAASNLVIGVGGILRYHSRDTLGFALKATYVEVNGNPMDIEKDPVTDHLKKSHKGLLCLINNPNASVNSEKFTTIDQCSWIDEEKSFLQTAFLDGKISSEYEQTFDQVRIRLSTNKGND